MHSCIGGSCKACSLDGYESRGNFCYVPKPKLLIILGPTGSGKTDLAVQLAKQFNGEVISADSRQVYKEISIGTNKVTKAEMQRVPHYCIDVASVRRPFGAAQWKHCAEKALKNILKHDKLPIIAGGTGYYIDILTGRISLPNVKPNPALRKELEKLSCKELFARLTKQDPERAATIERGHKRRLIRALEIVDSLGKVPQHKPESPYDVLYIGLTVDESQLAERIEKRMHYWFRRGFRREVQNLLDIKLGKDRLQELGFEYTTVARYLRKEITKEAMEETLVRELMKYVKRQNKWFRRNKAVVWFDANGSEKIADRVSVFLKK